jgi:hypothetical protein
MALLSLQINALIEDFRKSVPVDSATARAIDRKDSRRKIALYAKAEGYLKFAEQLEQALAAAPARENESQEIHYTHRVWINSKTSSS